MSAQPMSRTHARRRPVGPRPHHRHGVLEHSTQTRAAVVVRRGRGRYRRADARLGAGPVVRGSPTRLRRQLWCSVWSGRHGRCGTAELHPSAGERTSGEPELPRRLALSAACPSIAGAASRRRGRNAHRLPATTAREQPLLLERLRTVACAAGVDCAGRPNFLTRCGASERPPVRWASYSCWCERRTRSNGCFGWPLRPRISGDGPYLGGSAGSRAATAGAQ